MTSPDVSATCMVLAELQSRRKFYIGSTNRQLLAAKALVRRLLGWRGDAEEGDREALNKRAGRIVERGIAGKEQAEEDVAFWDDVSADIMAIGAAIAPLVAARAKIERDMRRAARRLPAAEWAGGVRGLGELALAVLVAEAGDLSLYPAKGHLWKRLGLAPHGGKAYSSWRASGGLDAAHWTDEAKYSPRRRAEIYACIDEPLFRSQSAAEGREAGPYRQVYDRRRAATAATHPDWSKLHSHRDALRVMTKAAVRDLWKEWNRRQTNEAVPARDKRSMPVGASGEDGANAAMPEAASQIMPHPPREASPA